MNKDKRIEEMAKDLQETHDYEGCEAWHCGDCQYEKYGKNHFCSSIKQAEKMTAKGYRKASEVVEEIFEEIEDKYADFLFDGHRNIVVLTEKDWEDLKNKYTEEK